MNSSSSADGIAPAGAPEIKITQEMISAGIRELHACEDGSITLESLARRVFRAMARLRKDDIGAKD